MENASNVNVVGESPFTYGERIGVAVLILVIFIFGLIGNSIVILAVVLSKELQTVFQCLRCESGRGRSVLLSSAPVKQRDSSACSGRMAI